MKLYNSLTSQIEEFKPLSDKISIYSCGPTVYDFVHIGNLSSFIYADILARTLRAIGYQINHVMNVTDVDDKIILKGNRDYPNLAPLDALKQITRKFEQSFMTDITKLNIINSNYTFIRATESIDLMQKLILEILDNKIAYIAEDGIYFSISSYQKSGKKYGKLVHLDINNDLSQSRIYNDEYDKATVHDFVLWKFAKPNEPKWSFIIDGKDYEGRPGWHIECSAMSVSLLGQPFDIHTGGIDLKFPHHENEIAQSTSDADELYLAKLFFHNEHLLIDSQKMSKSLNNTYGLSDIKNEVSDLIAFRLLILQGHYRNQSNFSYESLKAAYRRLLSYKNLSVLRFQLIEKPTNFDFETTKNQIISDMSDDLNSPRALATLSVFVNQVEGKLIGNNQKTEFEDFIKFIDDVFGFNLLDITDISKAEIKIIQDRKKLRLESNWLESDQLRDKLLDQKIAIIDTESTDIWQLAD
jgi:cysteinyl-tRNA synthetase